MTAFRDVFERTLALHATKPMKRLMSATALLDFALSAISLFEPIYLHTLGWSLSQICLFYFAVYAAGFFLLPLGVRYAGRIGLQHAILFSTPFLIAYYLALYAIPKNPAFIIVAVFALVLQKILYWPGFDSEMAAFGSDGERGREVSILTSLGTVAAVVGPAFGGFIVGAFGFPIGFALTGLLMLLSNLPLLSMPPERPRESLGYRQSIKSVFARENRRFLTAMGGFGEEFTALIIWPIFIYTVLGDIASTGVLVSVSIFLTALALLFIGRLSDAQSRHAVVRTGSIFTAFSWILRLFLGGAAGVLIGDFFYRVVKALLGVPFVTVIYERAGRGPLLERIAHYEMSIFVGKSLMLLIGAVLAWLLPGNFTVFFLLAAGSSLLYSRLP